MGFGIGQAVKYMQDGKRVARAGWNGKGMYLYLDQGCIRTALTTAGATAGTVEYQPCIVMRTARGEYQPGWLASQADLLAMDWEVVPDVRSESDGPPPPAAAPGAPQPVCAEPPDPMPGPDRAARRELDRQLAEMGKV